MNIFIAFLYVLACAIASPVHDEPKPYTPEMGNPCSVQYVAFPTGENGELVEQDLWIDHGELDVSPKDLKFYLYTKNNEDEADIISPDGFNLTNTHFLPSRRNIFVSHGYLNDYSSPVNTVLRKAILPDNDVNLFILDWSKQSKTPWYFSAARAVPKIGRLVGDFIKRIMYLYNIQPSAFDLIGHSLGGHLVGFAGKQVDGRLNSIFGLDPAGPCFSGNAPENRINATDAGHVQIMHTSYLYGLGNAIGDADYYPNNGNMQPGCSWIGQQVCSHNRVFELHAESITNGGFTSHHCGSHKDYKAGKCDNNHKSYMGKLNMDKTAVGTYYLDTNGEPPYSRN